MTSSPSSDISIYSSVYNHGQPDKQQAKQIREETFQRYSTTQTRRSQLQRNERSANVASCLVWNNIDNENETTKTNEKLLNIITPITLKFRNNFHGMPTINQKKSFQSQSMTMLKNNQQSWLGTSISREHRANTSLDQTHTNSVQCLISKYM